jgi:hypothetical protein
MKVTHAVDQMSNFRPRRRTAVFAASLTLALCALPLLAVDDDTMPAGRIIDAPTNLRTFSPEDTSEAVDARNINLRHVFEELGPEATTWYQHVMTLSNPFFEGRAPETRGGEVAAEYIEFYFRQYGLEPAFFGENDNGSGGADGEAAWTSYRQPFDFPMRGRPVRVLDAEVRLGDEVLTPGDDYVVLANSSTAEAAAPIVFVGYGVQEGENDYNSFGDRDDLSGRIAMVFRYEPLDDEGNSRWSNRQFSPHSTITDKFSAIADRKPAGIILVNPPDAAAARPGLEPLERSSNFGRPLGVPIIQMTPEAADALVRRADPRGRDLLTLRKLADDLEVTTIDFDPSVQMHMQSTMQHSTMPMENVGAALRGKGDLADEWIVIGGHFDHVGYGYTGIRRRSDRGTLHPGADDNASGTAGVLVLADRLARHYANTDEGDLRSIMFVLFGAEEAGLHGSRYFTENPPLPIEQITFMANFDMIGRLRDHTVMLSGVGTADEFEHILPAHIERSGLTVAVSPGGFGPSDHANFFRAGIPVLFAFTGLHPEYHAPEDKGYTVNPWGAALVLQLMEPIILDIARLSGSLTFNAEAAGRRIDWNTDRVRDDATPRPRVADRSDDVGDMPGRDGAAPPSVRLGIMPDYGADLVTGVRVDAVFDDTSAADGGVMPGDVLLEWNGEPIADGMALMNFLRRHKPGDVVRMTVLRGNSRVDLEVTLKAGE